MSASRNEPLLNAPITPSDAPVNGGRSVLVTDMSDAEGDRSTFIDLSDKPQDEPSPPSSSICGQGSRWGTTFNMCSAILGAGALSLPHAVAAMGVIPAVVLLLFTAVATHYSIILLIHAITASNTKSFEDLTQQVFGKINGLLVELAIIIFQYGTLVAYTVAIGDILEPLTNLPAIHSHVPWLTRNTIIVLFWAVLMLPLSFVERISSLQFTSLFGVLALVYLVTAVLIHFLFDASLDPKHTVGAMSLGHLSEGAVSAAAIIMFAFTCQINVPSVYQELNVKTLHEMSVVSIRAVTLCLLCYLIVGIAGYADFPSSSEGNLLKNYCLLEPIRSSAASLTSEDPWSGSGGTSTGPPRVITAAYVAITITIVMAYPVNVYPTRYTLDQMAAHYLAIRPGAQQAGRVQMSMAQLPYPRHRGHHSTYRVSRAGHLDRLLTYGGTASAYVCYIIPAAAAWKLRGSIPSVGGSLLGRIGCLSLLCFGLVVGVLSTATTIAGLFHPEGNVTIACDVLWNETHPQDGGGGGGGGNGTVEAMVLPAVQMASWAWRG